MPIYEYKCRDCGEISEFLVGVGQEKIKFKCGSCGGIKLEKIFSQSFISTGGRIIGSQGGKTCCGRDERCDIPPCSDGGVCRR